MRSTGRERSPGHLAGVLADLGPMPPAARPRDRATWVAALINPLPALGVSLEIRPAVLCAASTGDGPPPRKAIGVTLRGEGGLQGGGRERGKEACGSSWQ